MTNLTEVFLAQAKEGGAEEFGITPDVIVCVRMQLLAVGVAPDFLGPVLALDIDRAWFPVILLAADVAPSLQQQYSLAGCSEVIGESPSTRTSSDYDHIVMIHGLCQAPSR